MLIVEGSDLVGKTSLVKELCKEAIEQGFPMIPQHFGLLPDSWDFFSDYLPYIQKRTVMDRFIISELIYGELLRNKCRISYSSWEALNRLMTHEKCMTIIIAAEPEFFATHVKKEHSKRGEVFNPEEIMSVNMGFLQTGIHHTFCSYKVDFTTLWKVENNRTFPSSNKTFIKNTIKRYIEMQNG